MSIDDYKIIKILGSGVFGTTYLVKKGKMKYALKIEKILPNEVKDDLSSPVWRDIDFAKTLGNKYPDFFMKIYDYDIIDECKHEQKYPEYIQYFSKELQESLDERKNSSFCSRKIYSLIDTTFQNLVSKLKDQNQIYSIVTQICYAIYLMHKEGYTHNDLHSGNIGIIYTDKKFIKIFDENIPTFGYQVTFIDYGYALHNKFKLDTKPRPEMRLSEKETHENAFKNELKKTLLQLLVNVKKLLSIHDKMSINWNKIKDEFYESNKGKVLQSYTKDKTELLNLYMMINPIMWEKLILEDKFKEYIPIDKLLQTEDYIFILENTPIEKLEDIKNIINYFIMKISL
jgi:hypothetical protein